MFIVRFGGGLGNQLFQYALLLTLKEKYPNEEIFCDITTYSIFNEHNGFEIPCFFEFNEKYMPVEYLKQYKPVFYWQIRKKRIIHSLKGYNRLLKIEKLLFFFRKYLGKLNYKLLSDKGSLNYNPGIFGIEKNIDCYFEGGWQNLYYYNLELLRKKITFNVSLNKYEQEIEKEIINTNSVAIHVRRGDFVSNGRAFDLCSMDYYKKAIGILKDIIGDEKLHFFLFSDDVDYIRSNFSLPNMKIVRGTSSGHDMYLMSCAKYSIIANSTFSLWGAILNRKPHLVICPKYFVRLDDIYYKIDVPTDWISIDNVDMETF